MLFLKELLALTEGKTKKVKKADPSLAGAKALNAALMSKRGGGHYDAKSDYVRSKEKQKLHREINESDE